MKEEDPGMQRHMFIRGYFYLPLLIGLLLSACGETGHDDGPNAKYKGILKVNYRGEIREFLLGRYNKIESCQEVVEFELQENDRKTVWIRPDWGYLSGGKVDGWNEATVTGGNCTVR
jgi:hypothetical protein